MNDPITQLGSRLRMARIAAGFKTAKAFVTQHNLSAPAYSLHETGKRAPSHTTLKRYSELLAVNFIWLVSGEGQPFSTDSQMATRSLGMVKPSDTSSHGIQETLLGELVETLWVALNERDEQASIKSVVIMALELYRDIIQAAPDEATQLKMVKPFVTVLLKKVG